MRIHPQSIKLPERALSNNGGNAVTFDLGGQSEVGGRCVVMYITPGWVLPAGS